MDLSPQPSSFIPLLGAFLGSILLALIYARSVLLHLGDGVIGGDGDGFENLWNNWWVKKSLLDLHQSPFFTNYIYYPTGVSLRYHTLNPFDGLVTMPFSLLLGFAPTLNVFFIISLVASVFCAFLLLRDLVGNSWAAFAGAALYTYANEHVVAFFSQGQSEKLSMEWLPLYLFFAFRAIHGRPIWSDGVLVRHDQAQWLVYLFLSVATMVIMSLVDWQYVMFAAFITGLYLLFILFTVRTIQQKVIIAGRLGAIAAMYAVIAVPTLLLPMIREAEASPWLNVSGQAIWHSIDLARLLGPGGLGNPGYLAAIVAGVGLWATFRRGGFERETALFWGLAVIVFYVLSLGPTLQFGGQDTGIPLPMSALQDLPVLSSGRNPGRFSLVALLGLAVLVAFGLRELFGLVRRWWDGRTKPSSKWPVRAVTAATVVVFLAITLAGFVSAAGNATVDPLDVPHFYQQIATDNENYAILDLPMFTDLGLGEQHYQAFQVVHNKPRFSGRWARDHKLTNPDNFVKHSSLFRHLLYMGYEPEQLESAYPDADFLQRTDYATQGLHILNNYDVRYIILYKDALKPEVFADYVSLLKEILGPEATPYYEDGQMMVYEAGQASAGGDPLTLDVGDGWFKAEKSPEGKVYRWANSMHSQQSELYTMNLSDNPITAKLAFTAYTWQKTRKLKVALNGTEVATLDLKPEEGEKPYIVQLTVPPGNNMITFTSPEAPQSAGQPGDSRELSFGMYGVSLDAEP